MHELIREIRAIAQTGLHYTRDPFDQQRFERLQEIAAQLYSHFSDASPAEVERFFIPETGYATPKVDLRACIVKDGRVLLVRERSDQLWTLPGGWADQNESPREGITREVKEESGFDVSIENLYAVKDRDRHPYQPKYPHSIFKLFFTGTLTGGQAKPNTEISEIDFFPPDQLPPLSTDRVLKQDILDGIHHHRQQSRQCQCD